MSMLFLAAMLAASQPHGSTAHATDVRSDADDALTDKFAAAIRKALPGAKNMRPEGGDDADDLYLTILFPVTPDGKRFDYAVDLMKTVESLPPNRLASFTGTCRETAIDACAKNLVSEADRKAKD